MKCKKAKTKTSKNWRNLLTAFLLRCTGLVSQVVRATNIIRSAMRFKLSLDETLLEPDVFHLKPQTSDTQWFKNVIR